MIQVDISPSSMREDHRIWNYEHSQWQTQIDRWRSEYKEALAQLSKMQERIRNYSKALDEHVAAISDHECALHDHRRDLAEYERMDSDDAADLIAAMSRAHQAEAALHHTWRIVHEEMQRRHGGMMAKLSALGDVMDDAEE